MIERKFIEDGMKKINIENYLKKELDKAGFTEMTLSKTPMVTRIILSVTRPGLAIGKGGKTIQNLTRDIEQKFNVENPQIEINEIKNINLDAKACVNKMISLIERGFAWKSVAFKTVEDVIGAGAQGVELGLRGKLAGKGGRKMKMRVAKGYMKKAGGQVHLVDYAKGDAYPKQGAIGIKLRIIRPGVVFPDKIRIKEFLKERELKKEEKKEVKVERVEGVKEDIVAKEEAQETHVEKEIESKKEEVKETHAEEKKHEEKEHKEKKENAKEESPKKEKKEKEPKEKKEHAKKEENKGKKEEKKE